VVKRVIRKVVIQEERERELARGEVLGLECERWVENGWCGGTAERSWKGKIV